MDIQTAFNNWLDKPWKNFGLVVEVKDTRRSRFLNPSKVFDPVNCTTQDLG